MRFLIIFLLLVSTCYAGEINKKYSYRDLSSRWGKFKDVPAEEINDTEIIGSGFGQNGIPYSQCFPEGMKGVLFTSCNLDNCIIPNGNTVGEGCTNKHHMVMNDGENWIVDEDLKPIEPLKKNRFEALGLSIGPKDIPLTKQTISVTQKKIQEIENAKAIITP